MSRVSVTYDNQIAHVRLTRADKMNAVDQDMIDAVIAAGNEVAASNARAVLFRAKVRHSALASISVAWALWPAATRPNG